MVFLIEKTFLSSIYYVLPDLATVDSIPSSSRPYQHNDHGDGDSLVSAHLKKHSTDQCLSVSIYNDSGIKVVSAFLRILGVAHVNSCQSLSKSCHRNDPGDDESTSCYMQCKNSLSPIQVHPMKLIRYPTNSAVQLPCQSVYGHIHTPIPLSV